MSKRKDFIKSSSLLEYLKTRRSTKDREIIKTIILRIDLRKLTRRESRILEKISLVSISLISRPLYITKEAY